MINFYDIMANQDWDPFVRGEQLTEATDPEGCFLGKLNGEVISSILALKYGKFGLISIYWVNEKYRGKGYGLKIFNKGMEYLKDCEIIGLDSVDEQVLNYEKYGFIKHSTSIKGMTKNRSD